MAAPAAAPLPSPALAVVHSAWINAWSLRQGCKAAGVDLRVAPGVERPLPLPRLPAGARPGWAFFTEEASLRAALQAGCVAGRGADRGAGHAAGTAPAPRHWPERFDPTLLDDKWAFAAWLAAEPEGPQGLAQWPLEDAQQARYPLLLKARHSWSGATKLPRGWVVRSAAELAGRLAALPAAGLPREAFFLQQWLGDAPLRVLSVGGFFDAQAPQRHLAVVTERLAGYGPGASGGDAGPSSSAMLANVPDAHGLVAQAAGVLQRLGFTGPYELEFLLAGDGTPPRVLELNPRFWMQHGLFVGDGNGVIRRYLGLDGPADWQRPGLAPALWVDASWLLRRLLRADGRALRALLAAWRPWAAGGEGPGARRRLVLCPSPGALLLGGLMRLAGRGAAV